MNKALTRLRVCGSMCGAALAGVVLAILTLTPTRAQANGAFPDSQGLLLPTDRPNQLILATNFGVVQSQDGGQTWTWSCERAANGMTAGFYQLSAAPRDRLYAITDIGLIYSDDSACGWAKAQGMLAGKSPIDYFPDVANADRVWAVRGPDVAGGSDTVVESLDGGNTFTTVRFTAAPGDAVNGVEIARADPNVAYVTIRSGTAFVPKLAVTRNGGTTWDTHDLSAVLGNVNVRIIAVDPTSPGKILLRVSPTAGDGIAVSLDFGATFVNPSPLTVPGGILTSFVRLPSGTLLLGGVDGVRDVIFRSTNGGTSFTELDAPLVRGLSQRNGRLFIVSSNDATIDGYAVGESTDEGTSWHALMRYEDIQAIEGCVKALCQDDCIMKADIGIWLDAVCAADPAPLPVDGSAPEAHDAAVAVDARSQATGGTGGHTDAGAGGSTPASSGCHCHAGGESQGGSQGGSRAGATMLVVAMLLASRRPRRRRAR